MKVEEVVICGHHVRVNKLSGAKIGLHLLKLFIFVRSELLISRIKVLLCIPKQICISFKVNIRVMVFKVNPTILERSVKGERENRLVSHLY